MTERMGAMAAGGAYKEGAQTQRGAARHGLSLIGPAIHGVEVTAQGAPLLFADFGAADGSNALAPIGSALDAVRRRAPERPVLVVHADIVANDFSSLLSSSSGSPTPSPTERANRGPMRPPRSTSSPVFWNPALRRQ